MRSDAWRSVCVCGASTRSIGRLAAGDPNGRLCIGDSTPSLPETSSVVARRRPATRHHSGCPWALETAVETKAGVVSRDIGPGASLHPLSTLLGRRGPPIRTTCSRYHRVTPPSLSPRCCQGKMAAAQRSRVCRREQCKVHSTINGRVFLPGPIFVGFQCHGSSDWLRYTDCTPGGLMRREGGRRDGAGCCARLVEELSSDPSGFLVVSGSGRVRFRRRDEAEPRSVREGPRTRLEPTPLSAPFPPDNGVPRDDERCRRARDFAQPAARLNCPLPSLPIRGLHAPRKRDTAVRNALGRCSSDHRAT